MAGVRRGRRRGKTPRALRTFVSSPSLLFSSPLPLPFGLLPRKLKHTVHFVSPEKNADPLTVTICEHVSRTISCYSGRRIDVLQAMYGRQNSYTCTNNGDRCSAGNSYSFVYNRCQNQGSCVLKASNNVFGDPCKGTPKYLYVKYQCVP